MIILSSDHAGFELKNYLVNYLKTNNIDFVDVGPTAYEKTDSYVDYTKKACKTFTENDKIILCCGSGVGVSIVANRHKGVRAVLGYSKEIVEKAVQHNNANCLCMGQNFIGKRKAVNLLKTFLNAKFEGGRHLKRVQSIDN